MTAPDDHRTELAALATSAYLTGIPIVFNLDQVRRYVTTGVGQNAAADWNTFSHARALATPDDRFVTINNDTVYSMAQLDLGVGPVLLRVPETGGRYFVLQFVDAWTNNVAYVGHRSTGPGAGEFLIVGPGFEGEAPDGAVLIRIPTRVASIVGRWAVNGEDDLPAVHALQDATTLTPLDPTVVPAGLPDVAPASTPALEHFERHRVLTAAFPPAARDEALLASFAPLGLTGAAPIAEAAAQDAAVAAALEAGFVAGAAAITEVLSSGGGANVENGWIQAYHSFDYNLDFFGVGTRDEPAFRIDDPQRRIQWRAASAIGGLWGNHAYEAAYAATYVDDRGERLTGDRTYTLHLSPLPPVDAFWSITMYDVPDYYLVANPADRYSIGDRTPGIVLEADGSIVITIAHEEPTDPVARANWLPAPVGAFRPVLRMYEPRAEAFDGRFSIPPIVRG